MQYRVVEYQYDTKTLWYIEQKSDGLFSFLSRWHRMENYSYEGPYYSKEEVIADLQELRTYGPAGKPPIEIVLYV